MILIQNGAVLTPNGLLENCDVVIDAAEVVSVGAGMKAEGAVVIDASGCYVGPGFVDLHAHLRDPGQVWKETLETGAAAASAGGFTALVAMPNTDPATDTADRALDMARRGDQIGLVQISPAGALTSGRRGLQPSELSAMYEAGVRIFSDDGDSVEDNEVLRVVMEHLSGLPGAVVSQHAELVELTEGGHFHDGEVAKSLGLGGLPVQAETDVVARDLDLVRATKARYHCQHVSSRATVALIESAKHEGLPVTAEVTPHHLMFVESDVAALGANLKMYPPVRSVSDREALVEALRNGTIDVVATDHAPHTLEEKSAGLEAAPRGVIGLETAASVTWEILDDPILMFESLSSKPAHIAGLDRHGSLVQAGAPANLVVFDPIVTWSPDEFMSLSANSPFLGRTLTGRARATIYEGTVSHRMREAHA